MRRDVLFRGCTRPAMFLGVPYVPFFVGAGACLLLAVYVNLLLLVLMPLVVLGMRQMARRDEMIFRLIGLRWQLLAKVRNRHVRRGDWSFAPLAGRGAGGRR
ncbi:MULTISPECIES: VirB3 family type IV secretion system protein [unclassified Luteimonas]|uniref:VirB3 family type IV secretion system protein n=1 Tax=unclassified Luteimonas TaxID=2629088 RepID=UPI0018F077B1|nr:MULTISPECIES: VirB3 family type IV secretion system protein [unclassified Luteimonas]MBJ6979642.1 VirB3 family type IV secretion system protein [Luteimonas sp. MC1895]MBJ6983073.1 VirB3 family type IV secretion system protein [Luteimonas sp. MC1750]QQO05214.1 VirB3 family type IV secretion system protein [Luteimonas sp. MC1750]